MFLPAVNPFLPLPFPPSPFPSLPPPFSPHPLFPPRAMHTHASQICLQMSKCYLHTIDQIGTGTSLPYLVLLSLGSCTTVGICILLDKYRTGTLKYLVTDKSHYQFNLFEN